MAANDDGSAIAGTSIRAALNASRSNPFHPRMHLVMVDGASWRKGTVAIINPWSEIVGGETWRSDNMQSSLVMITSSQPPCRYVDSSTCWISPNWSIMAWKAAVVGSV